MKSRRTFFVFLLLFVVVGGAASVLILGARERLLIRSPLLTQEPTIITYLEGLVETQSGTDGEWETAEIGQRLREDDRLRTGADGLVDLRVYGEGVIRLLEETEIALESLTIRRQTIGIFEGKVFAKFRLLFDQQDLRFSTPNALAAVRGTELVFVVDEFGTAVHALSGITEISNPAAPDERILLAFQTTTRVDASSPPSDPVAMSPELVEQYKLIFNGIHSEEVFLIAQNIHFEPNTSTVVEASLAELDEVARLLKQRRVNIVIAGHTADVGNTSAQVRLSEERAQSIREELIARRISPRRLTTVGYGGSRPVGNNSTAEGRAVNRRVEFLIAD